MLLATFCLRLALGMIACLPLLFSAEVQPRFYRTHFLTMLGLLVVAGAFLAEQAGTLLWVLLAADFLFGFAGAVAFSAERAPGGRTWVVLAATALLGTLVQLRADAPTLLPDDLTSAALLGSCMTAMLLGHSYLISPTMSLKPLFTLLRALGAAVLLRVGLALFGLWAWTRGPVSGTLEQEVLLWLPVRWALGFVLPLVLGWMAYETARIRSTQSATGILYVVVIFCFLGELTAQLLVDKTGYVL
jgi:hypothetical protein